MAMHPRVSLHQVAFITESTAAFAQACREIGVRNMTLVTPLLTAPGGMDEAKAAVAGGDLRVSTVNHVFAPSPDLEGDDGQATAGLMRAIDIAATLGAEHIYLVTGARGSLDWEQAAARFAELVAPCREPARAAGITLLVENANMFNADIHIAHTLADVTRLAEIAGISLCLDIHGFWFESGLKEGVRRALPNTGLVQVSDYVLGDRSTPCRAVPGDGIIPHERIIGDILDAGYEGLFDLELVGPRIQAEGAKAASARSAEYLSELLTRLGA
jgi:sugar phosphate isomerase/epimerase